MSAYVIFDPKNNLIFSKCDDSFRTKLLDVDSASNDPPEDINEDEDEMAHNWLSIYLTPYASMIRESPQGKSDFDLIPSTSVVHKNYQEFLFMHLICHHQAEKNDEQQSIVLHQFKVNVFCQSSIFLCGNALHYLAKNKMIQKTMFDMIDKWNTERSKITFMIESIEKLHVGFHVTKLCQELAVIVEKILKLELKTSYKEIFSFSFVLYRDKLVFKYESISHVRLKPRDLSMILLISQLNDAEPELINNNHEANKRQSIITLQKLVFLQSSSQIPVPHVLRKILISHDLYIVCLSEISSILMISLPSLIHSVIDHKTNILDTKQNSKRSIDYLIKCIRSMDKYIKRNLTASSKHHLFNMSSLENLNQLAKRVHSRRTSLTDELIHEQTDRIFSVLIDNLYQSYEKVFKTLLMEIEDSHFKQFNQLICNFSNIDQIKQLNNCLEFINIKHEKNFTLLDNLQALKVYSNLLAFVFVDRVENFFFEDHQERVEQDIVKLYQNLVLQSYRKAIQFNRNLVFWLDEPFLYTYVCWKESLKNLEESSSENTVIMEQLWPNTFIDEWFERSKISNEFFAIIDSNSFPDTLLLDTKLLLDYLANIVNKIDSHVNNLSI